MDFKSSSGGGVSPWQSAQQRHLRRNSVPVGGSTGADTLQMYLAPPTGQISLEQFDALAVERLQVLRAFERADQCGKQKYSGEWSSFILAELKRQKLTTYLRLLDPRPDTSVDLIAEACRRDHVSHFILRLAYCRTDELRGWFITHELELFRMRFMAQKSGDSVVYNFLADNGINIVKVSDDERHQLWEELRAATARLGGALLDVTTFYTVPFWACVELVRGRRVLVRAGRAYLPGRDLAVVAANRLRAHLQRCLAVARRVLPSVESDTRLRAVLNDFDKQYTGRQYGVESGTTGGASVTPADLDQLSVQSFPPCMRQLHDRLRSTHKLLHGGRMQYGLFLKAIGLSLQDAVTFWRQEFTQVMDTDKFNKQYLYNIRHNYGQEGKRTSYTPHTCGKVITSGANDAGCPFKHSDRDHLVKLMQKFGISSQDVASVADIAGQGQPQLACQKFWQLRHGCEFPAGAVAHPNQFYEESRKQRTGAVSKHAGLDTSKYTRASLGGRKSTSGADGTVWDDTLTTEDMDEALSSAV